MAGVQAESPVRSGGTSRVLTVDFARTGWVSVEGRAHLTAYGCALLPQERAEPKILHSLFFPLEQLNYISSSSERKVCVKSGFSLDLFCLQHQLRLRWQVGGRPIV